VYIREDRPFIDESSIDDLKDKKRQKQDPTSPGEMGFWDVAHGSLIFMWTQKISISKYQIT
jgi:hypothetical protein